MHIPSSQKIDKEIHILDNPSRLNQQFFVVKLNDYI